MVLCTNSKSRRLSTRKCGQIGMGCLSSTRRMNTNSTTDREEFNRTSENVGSTFVHDEVEKFSQLAQRWWDEAGEFKALHTMNYLRVPLIRDGLLGNVEARKRSIPLQGYKLLDVGCGGGILTEPLARLGAHILGLDASQENINMAQWHAEQDPVLNNNLSYRCQLVEEHAVEEAGNYDGVIASEIIEHVGDVGVFVAACAKLVKPGGSVFFTTINRTYVSYALAVVAAEQILRVVPAGAHDWNKFVPPEDLQIHLRQNDLETRLIHGMCLNPLTMKWQWIKDTSINYALHAVKLDDKPKT